MRHFTKVRVLLLVVVWATTAALVPARADKPTSQPTTQEALRSFKGWELYAWKEGDNWQFALLEGTNRDKADDEILDKKERLADVAAVKAKLSGLAAGEWVTLSTRNAGGKLPSGKVQQELKAFCEDHELHWQ